MIGHDSPPQRHSCASRMCTPLSATLDRHFKSYRSQTLSFDLCHHCQHRSHTMIATVAEPIRRAHARVHLQARKHWRKTQSLQSSWRWWRHAAAPSFGPTTRCCPSRLCRTSRWGLTGCKVS